MLDRSGPCSTRARGLRAGATPHPCHVPLFNCMRRRGKSLGPHCPITTQDIPVVQDTAAGRELTWMRWGFIPSWAKDPNSGPLLINARSETAAEKPAFRSAFKNSRCLIPVDGFYEWKKTGAKKQPYHIRREDDRPFAFAGLWGKWHELESCTIWSSHSHTVALTPPLLAKLHLHQCSSLESRFFAPKPFAAWLNGSRYGGGSASAPSSSPLPSSPSPSAPLSGWHDYEIQKAENCVVGCMRHHLRAADCVVG
jgi:putative SOS response-associated peptidase YedK